MSIKQRVVNSIAAHPGYMILISLIVVTILSVALGTIGTQEAVASGANALVATHRVINNKDRWRKKERLRVLQSMKYYSGPLLFLIVS